MKLGDETGDDLGPELLRVFDWEIFEAAEEIDPILTHDIVRYDLLRFGIVGGAQGDDVVGVREPS